MARQAFDTPWKTILDVYFQECISFFFSKLWQSIDWTKPVEFLDKELLQITKDSETGRRIVDKLAKVILNEGEEAHILLAHIEVQGQPEVNFAERLFIYNNRIFDKHRKPIVTIAILTDGQRDWKPVCHESHWFGCHIYFAFHVIKLLDYQGQKESLFESDNPFAFVVLAQLGVIECRKSESKKLTQKTQLARHLYTLAKKKNKGGDFLRNLIGFLDWVLALAEPFELEYGQTIHQIEEELHMRYVTSMEHRAKEEGLKEGVLKGKLEGKQEGAKSTSERIALELLREKLDISFIARITQLDKAKITALKARLQKEQD